MNTQTSSSTKKRNHPTQIRTERLDQLIQQCASQSRFWLKSLWPEYIQVISQTQRRVRLQHKRKLEYGLELIKPASYSHYWKKLSHSHETGIKRFISFRKVFRVPIALQVSWFYLSFLLYLLIIQSLKGESILLPVYMFKKIGGKIKALHCCKPQ